VLAKSLYGKVLEQLDLEYLLNLHHMGPYDELCKSMLWRCKAIWDYSNAEAVFFRDIDSCPTYRERCANEEFINSEFYVHGINDNKKHTIALLGGMWGCKPKYFIQLTNYNSWEVFTSLWKHFNLSYHGCDQLFLRDKILPLVKQNLIVHKNFVIKNSSEMNDVERKKFVPFIGVPGYEKVDVIKFCDSKNTQFIKKLKYIETKYGIDAKKYAQGLEC
ncbi:MAG: hypothetical protein QQN41_07915, partial [Nitrosopumilus sp.]